MAKIDYEYVAEILCDMPQGLSRDAFFNLCQNDINQGWRDEVCEAYRRYVKGSVE